jgi:hypothetical protein
MDLFEVKNSLNQYSVEEKDLFEKKVDDVLGFKNEYLFIKLRISQINPEIFSSKEVSLKIEQLDDLLKKIDGSVQNYEALCDRARIRLVVQLDGIVKESEIEKETKNYPGNGILYKSMLKLKTPDYIFALMQQKVLKAKELNRSLASEIKKSPDRVFSYDELLIKDYGASLQALHRAFLKLGDVLAGKTKPDFHTDEFCFFQNYAADKRVVFVSIVNLNRKIPNPRSIKAKFGPNWSFDPKSEASLISETEIKIHAGSIDGTPVSISVSVPYLLRSYSIVKI